MRDFSPLAYASLPQPTDPHFTSRLRDIFSQIDLWSRDASTGFALIQQGMSPSGGGTTPLIDTTGLFILAGQSGGQIAHGDTVPSGTLTFSSTNSLPKGKIYLGENQTQAAFDENLGFLGIGNVAPNALLHLTSTATFINMENSSFNVLCTAASGDTSLQSAEVLPAGFAPSSPADIGPTVTAGMLVSGTGIAANTYVKHVDSNAAIWISAATTQTITAAAITFTPSTLYRQKSDETGRDTDLLMQGSVRMTTGVGTAPLRFIGDAITAQSSITINPTVAGCTAPGGGRVISCASTSGVANGDIVSGGTVVTNTHVESFTGTTITVSTIVPVMGASTLTFKHISTIMCIESGTVSGGSATGSSLQLGGPSRGELALLNFKARTVWIGRNSLSGTNACVGINTSPQDYGAGGPSDASALVVATNPIMLADGATIQMRGASTGTSPAMVLGAKLWDMDASASPNMGWYTGSYGAEVRSFYLGRESQNSGAGAREAFRIVNQQAGANNNMMSVVPALEWATIDVSPAFTTRLDFGDKNKGILAGRAGVAMTQLGICAAGSTVSNGTSQTIPIPLALLHADITTGTTSDGIYVNGASGSYAGNLLKLHSGVASTTDALWNQRSVQTTGRIKSAVLFTDDNATIASARLSGLDNSLISLGATRTLGITDRNGNIATDANVAVDDTGGVITYSGDLVLA